MRGCFIALRSREGGYYGGHDSSSHWPDFSLGLCGEGDAPPCRTATPPLSSPGCWHLACSIPPCCWLRSGM